MKISLTSRTRIILLVSCLSLLLGTAFGWRSLVAHLPIPPRNDAALAAAPSVVAQPKQVAPVLAATLVPALPPPVMTGCTTPSFGAATNLGAGTNPRSVAVGDFNLDGKPDLAVANFLSNNVSALLNNCTANTAPTITALGVMRTAGSPVANSQIATALDAEDAEETLQITISNDGMTFGNAATLNGVTVTLTDSNAGATGTNPDALGKVFADIVATCAASNATFKLRVTDSGGLTDTKDFTVTVMSSASTVNPVTPAAICSGGTTNIPLTSTPSGASFSWTIGTVTGTVTGQAVGTGATIAQTLTGSGSVTYIVTPTLNGCPGTPVNIVQTVNALPTITDPTDVNLLQGGTATFSVTASGTPAPTVQWQVSTDGGMTFTDIPGATNPTLTLPNVTPAMNGYRYRAIASNACGTATSRAATLNVSSYSAKFEDPLVCLAAGDLVTITASITNNGAAAVTATYNVTNLAPNLIGIPGSGVASVAPANFVVTATGAAWNGTLQPGETVTFTFKAQIAAGVPLGAQVCITSTATLNGGVPVVLQPCTILACPPGGINPAVSAQKPGSLLVFPYYTSKAALKTDTRFTLSNVGAQQAFVHLFFIDGASCQPADQFLCLTPNASFAGKVSETDPEATGWILAVAVNAQGRPIQYNGLIGNAFVNEGEYVGNYGAEAFLARSPLVAALQGDTALLFLDGVGYDAVPNQFAMEVQSPLDAPNQRVVTVGLRGDLNASTMTGAGQVGSGIVINGNEKPMGSFTGWLSGSCQAIALLTNTSPRVPTGSAACHQLARSGSAMGKGGRGAVRSDAGYRDQPAGPATGRSCRSGTGGAAS